MRALSPLRPHWPFVLLLAFTGLAIGCTDTDIGAPCKIHKDRPDPTLPGCSDVKVDEARTRPECFRPTIEDLRAGGDKDFISFGAAECDNLTCLRSRDDTLTKEERAPASEGSPTGYCSGECINDQDCKTDGDTKYACRALVFDDEFIHYLQDTLSPEEYSRYLGRMQNSKFCARVKGDPKESGEDETPPPGGEGEAS